MAKVRSDYQSLRKIVVNPFVNVENGILMGKKIRVALSGDVKRPGRSRIESVAVPRDRVRPAAIPSRRKQTRKFVTSALAPERSHFDVKFFFFSETFCSAGREERS